MTQYVYELIQEKTEEFELKPAGYYALESLRIEKGNKAWGTELKADINPYEAGLGFTVDWDRNRGDFLGKKALMKIKKEGIRKNIVSFTLENEKGLFLLGEEPIYKDNQFVGYVTSAKFGYSLDKWACLGLVENSGEKIEKNWLQNGEFEIEVLQKRVKAQIHLKSPYDPECLEVKNN